MKKANQFLSKLKKTNDELFLNVEKITIIDRNKLYIQNYHEILEISDDKIALKAITVEGKNLKIVNISKYFVEINGTITDVHLGDAAHEK